MSDLAEFCNTLIFWEMKVVISSLWERKGLWLINRMVRSHGNVFSCMKFRNRPPSLERRWSCSSETIHILNCVTMATVVQRACKLSHCNWSLLTPYTPREENTNFVFRTEVRCTSESDSFQWTQKRPSFVAALYIHHILLIDKKKCCWKYLYIKFSIEWKWRRLLS
jgi:hypothetical protein